MKCPSRCDKHLRAILPSRLSDYLWWAMGSNVRQTAGLSRSAGDVSQRGADVSSPAPTTITPASLLDTSLQTHERSALIEHPSYVTSHSVPTHDVTGTKGLPRAGDSDIDPHMRYDLITKQGADNSGIIECLRQYEELPEGSLTQEFNSWAVLKNTELTKDRIETLLKLLKNNPKMFHDLSPRVAAEFRKVLVDLDVSGWSERANRLLDMIRPIVDDPQ